MTETRAKSPGELAIWAYLESRELSFQYEPFEVGANPDFVVQHPRYGQVVMDAYEPVYQLLREPDGSVHSGFAVSPEGRLRRAFKSQQKAAQAKVALDAGSPFVLVLARSNSEVEFEDHHVVGALFGSVQITFGLDEVTGDDAPIRLVFGQGGRLQSSRNTRFSAVAVISSFNPGMARVEREAEERFTPRMTVRERIAEFLSVRAEESAAGRFKEEEQTFRLKVFHNPFAKIPLSAEFAGPHDDQWMGSQIDGSYFEATWGIQGLDVPGRRALEVPE